MFMEQRSKFSATIDLQSSGPASSAASLAAALASTGEFAIAVRGGRTYGLRLTQGAVPRARMRSTIGSALVTGGSKVLRQQGCHRLCTDSAPSICYVACNTNPLPCS